MYYLKIRNKETLEQGIKRNLTEQIRYAKQILSNIAIDPDYTIHEIRKNLKRIRSILRLIEFSVGRVVYTRENYFYRDIGRILSPVRDSKVKYEVIEIYKDIFYRRVSKFSIEKLIESWRYQHQQYLLNTDIKNLQQKVAYFLKSGEQRSNIIIYNKNRTEDFLKGYQKTFLKCKYAIEIVSNSPSALNFHELRKRIKYFLYQSQLLSGTWPDYFDFQNKILNETSDLLGHLHDLELVATEMETSNSNLFSVIQKKRFINRIKAYNKGLGDSALKKIRQIFAESSKNFIQRMDSHLMLSI
ncbi:MAG: CHAD domain-containing protein [Bacteroidales bacterium]|nr:CHAD domain-containing protein [Bacteroidales bacterium]